MVWAILYFIACIWIMERSGARKQWMETENPSLANDLGFLTVAVISPILCVYWTIKYALVGPLGGKKK